MVYPPKGLNPPYLLRLCEQQQLIPFLLAESSGPRSIRHPYSVRGRREPVAPPASVLHVARNALFGMGGMEGTLGLT